jgi:hypothetical protein
MRSVCVALIFGRIEDSFVYAASTHPWVIGVQQINTIKI